MSNYYTILTNIGKAKVTNAQVLGNKLNITHIVIGDGKGNPSENQTTLKNKVWQGQISMISIDEDNPNWIVIEGIIPADIGGFTVREVGILDDKEDLIAVGNYPETYKPVLEEGSSKDLYLRMIIEVSNASAVELKIDPTVAIPSQSWVSKEIEQATKTLIPRSIIGEAGGVASLNEDGKIPDEQLDLSDYAKNVNLENKVDKVPGKGLSTNDYTTEEKEKLAGVEAGANKYDHPATHPASMITETTNKRFVSDKEKVTWNNKQDTLPVEQKRNIFISEAPPESPSENDIWIEIEPPEEPTE